MNTIINSKRQQTKHGLLRKLKHEVTIPSVEALIDEDSSLYGGAEDTFEILQKQYCSAFSNPNMHRWMKTQVHTNISHDVAINKTKTT